jgi:hypothetical protein
VKLRIQVGEKFTSEERIPALDGILKFNVILPIKSAFEL